MDKYVQKMWDKNNHKLKECLANYDTEEWLTYKGLVKMCVETLFDDDYDEFVGNIIPDPDRITTIDYGDYQGTYIFIIGSSGYQPSASETWYTHNYYGSCSGCDTLQSIVDCFPEDKTFNEAQVEGLHTLCLHMMQRMKRLEE